MAVNGWLILDKPLAMSSAKAVDIVKRLLKPVKIGHAGTLDPLASGILPLALGEATKTVAYAMDKPKAYRFCIQWGQERSTDDSEGEVTASHAYRPSQSEIESVIPSFIGDILQIPPAYSAIKVGGKRAYSLARAGEQVELKARQVLINALKLLECRPESAVLEVKCGKGTYVRSLARDMARSLGTCGYVSELRRLSVGKFDESEAISLEKLESLVHNGELAKKLQPVESMLDDIPAWEINSTHADILMHGGMIALTPHEVGSRYAHLLPGQAALGRAHYQGQMLAIVEISHEMMKPVRVFNHAAGGR